ncbi:tetratricopeptide (TPR) repeat protein [Nocardioides thalensis]|uniref:Tetratricopeptide (TPR) repeat protein n=1 Tax=Nocardioides thalensis TaxID=1914755 RepID=A0A853C2L2_9ACTN|nr:CHAT domain-containing protein [Nocardioides thalensis]NYJ01417.1 tetratricopeptide (TPR) repeat protein [Nocardioides thalensis]
MTADTDVDTLIEDAAAWMRRDTDRSAELLDRADSVLDGQRDLGRAAKVSEIRGAIALRRGELGVAATAYRLARRNWLAMGRRLEALGAALAGAKVQLLLGEFEAGEAAVVRVQAQLRHEPHQDRRVAQLQADVHRQLGDALAGRGRIAEANRHYDTAGNLFAALGDVSGMAGVARHRGLAALDAGLTHNALLALADARAKLLSVGEERPAAIAALIMAEGLATSGQAARALEVVDCVEPELAHSAWAAGLTALVRANALLRLGSPAESHAAAREAEQVFTGLGAIEYSARAALACARALLRWGRLDAAASDLSVAERLFLECGSTLMLARTWLVRAELAVAAGDPDTARAACRRVLDVPVDDTAPSLGVHARLVAARAGEPDEARALLDDAADLAARSGLPELRVDVLLAVARLQRRLGQLDEAIESLRRALAEERVWQAGMDGQAHGSPSAIVAETTDELIGLLLERNDHAGRVEAWQRARRAKSRPAGPAAVRTGAGHPAPHGDRLARLLDDVGRNAWATWEPAPEQPLPEVPWETLIDYYVSGDDILVFVLRDGMIDARALPDAAPETSRLVRAWQQECRLMAAGVGATGAAMASSPSLEGLYDVLVAPVADLLSDLEEDLGFLGHRHLHAIPFDALLDAGAPWGDRLARRTTPVHRETQQGGGADLATLVLAVPDDNAPLITAEAEMIFRALPRAEILIGAEATSSELALRARAADVVHLACHGVFRLENPLASALRLGDGWLEARDIIGGSIDLGGAVVVLSACGSGLSPDYASAPVGLAPACLEAGASGVVAALWVVDDAVTLELMTSFYRALAQGDTAESALRQARRHVARRHPHPYYWAAFRYIGASTAAS